MRNLKTVLACLPLGLWACSSEKEVLDLHNPPPKSFRVLVSGEEIIGHGIGGQGGHGHGHGGHGHDAVFFEDGWELTFDSAIVTIANVQLSENPDMSPGDQSMTGPVVADLEGVFAIELKSNGGFGLHGHDHALGILSKQNKKKDAPAFDSQTRYAFGYSLVRATPEAAQLGLSEEAKADYERMIERSYSIFVRGTAKHRGEHCRTSDESYDFTRLPSEFRFELGFDMPVSYKNCENSQLLLRGVQVKDNAAVDVVVSLHFDHLFWEALEEDASLRLDAWAASKSVEAGPAPHGVLVSNADLEGVEIQGVKDAQGNTVPYRSCGSPQAGEKEGVLAYDTKGVPINRLGGAAGLAGLDDFIKYNLSTFGHLNGSGLCYPHREYPSPP